MPREKKIQREKIEKGQCLGGNKDDQEKKIGRTKGKEDGRSKRKRKN